MTQEDKLLLLVDICGRLPYGVKLLVEGWDSDRDCKFDTVLATEENSPLEICLPFMREFVVDKTKLI